MRIQEQPKLELSRIQCRPVLSEAIRSAERENLVLILVIFILHSCGIMPLIYKQMIVQNRRGLESLTTYTMQHLNARSTQEQLLRVRVMRQILWT